MNDTGRDALLPAALGFADGILNALTLTAGSLLNRSGGGVSVGLALRVSCVALVTAGFAMLVGEFTSARATLRHSAKQLTMESERDLFGTKLASGVLWRSLRQSAIASATSCVGALAPLLLAAVIPGPQWIAAAVAIAALAGLGAALGRISLGSPGRWAALMLCGGVIVTIIGAALNIA